MRVYILACCKLHRRSVLAVVEVVGSTGEHPYTVTTILCGDFATINFQRKEEGGTLDS